MDACCDAREACLSEELLSYSYVFMYILLLCNDLNDFLRVLSARPLNGFTTIYLRMTS